MSWYVLGIDNGLSGYVCLLKKDTGEYRFIPTPITSPSFIRSELHFEETEGGREYDVERMLKITRAAAKVSNGCCVGIIEDTIATHNGVGKSRTTMKSRESLMKGKTLWGVALKLAGIDPLLTVAPSRWKSQMGLLGKDRDKTDSIRLAQSFGVSLPVLTFPRKPPEISHDAADAFLLAKWLSMKGVVSQWE